MKSILAIGLLLTGSVFADQIDINTIETTSINNNMQAKADFQMALEISPDFSWAKMLLKNQP